MSRIYLLDRTNDLVSALAPPMTGSTKAKQRAASRVKLLYAISEGDSDGMRSCFSAIAQSDDDCKKYIRRTLAEL